MKNGKYSKRKGVATKTLVMALAVMLIVGCTIGGTLAWLTAQTAPVVNTFTVGDINIDLYEHQYIPTNNTLSTIETVKAVTDYKIVPGTDLPKDPTVEVKANSEACWLFIKVEENKWPACVEVDGTTRKIAYSVLTGEGGWTLLEDGVYYREVEATGTNAVTFKVLTNDKVTVSENLTKTDLESIRANGNPTLTFTAYAVQKDNVATAAAAWEIANPS